MTPGRRWIQPAAAYALTVTAGLAGLLILWDRSLAGFPDGHVTDLERALSPYQLGVACLCFGCAAIAAVTGFRREPGWWASPMVLWLAVALGLGGLWGVSAYLSTGLNHGQGG